MSNFICLWLGRLVLGACAFLVIPSIYWFAFSRLLDLVDPTRAFYEFYRKWLNRIEAEKERAGGRE